MILVVLLVLLLQTLCRCFVAANVITLRLKLVCDVLHNIGNELTGKILFDCDCARGKK